MSFKEYLNPRVEPKNVLITGWSNGFGLALTKYLVAEKHVTFGISRTGVDIDSEMVKTTAQPNFGWVNCWLQRIGDPEIKLLKDGLWFRSHVSCFDWLIFNAGYNDRQYDQWNSVSMEHHYEANTLGHARLFTYLAKDGLLSPECRILVMGSALSHYGSDWAVGYAMAKSALETFVRCVLKKYPGMSARILWPGRMNTPGNPKRDLPPDDLLEFKEPEEIVPTAYRLLSEELPEGVRIDLTDLGS